MFIKNIKLSKKYFFIIIIFAIIILLVAGFFVLQKGLFKHNTDNNKIINYAENIIENNINVQNAEESPNVLNENTSYIKWFEFNVSYNVLLKTYNLDISSHNNNESVKYNWIELISYLACKYGNDFNRFKNSDLDSLVSKLKNGETIYNLTKNMKNYSYYYEGYSAVLSQFIGEYYIQNVSDSTYTKKYALKAFHPLSQNYSYSHYDDFGNSRSYGYKRIHLGNDLMGSIRNSCCCS